MINPTKTKIRTEIQRDLWEWARLIQAHEDIYKIKHFKESKENPLTLKESKMLFEIREKMRALANRLD